VEAAQVHREGEIGIDDATRVATAARSGLIDLHFAFVMCTDVGRINVLMSGLAKKLTLRASGGSNTSSSYT